MRCLLLAVVAGLAVLSVQIRAEDVAIVDDFEIDDSTLRQMLGDLFEFDESDDDLGSDREDRARGDDVTGAEEEKAIAVDPKEQLRYNSFIDTFLRRLNSFARSRFDPLSVGLGKKGKSSSKGGKAKKGKNAKSGNRKGKKGGNKSGKKDKKSEKKKGRQPKDLDLDDAVHEGEEAVVDVEEEEVHEIEKREAEFEVVEIEEEEEDEEADLDEEEDEAEEGSLVRVAREADEEADDSPMEETSRRVKPAKGGKKGATRKGGKKSGKKGKGTKKSGKKGGKNKKGKKGKSGNKKGKKAGKKGKKGENKKGRHPKDLDLDEIVQEEQEAVVDVEEEEVHEVEKREAEFEVVEIEEEEEEETDLEEEEDEAEEDSLVRVARDADEETVDSPMEETSRRAKPAKGGKKGAAKKGRKKGGKKGKGKKKSGTKGGKKSGKKSGKKGRTGGKKKGGHPKDLDLDEVVQEGKEAVVDVEEKEEEGHEVEKREAELEVIEIEEEEEEEDEAEENALARVARDAKEETDDSPMEETSRRGESAKGGKKGATKKGGKKSGKKGKGKKKSAKNKSGPRTSRADVSGIATLIRDGDVLVRNKKGGKEMRATFTMGPVQLKVNRKFGSGKKAISREAVALSPELTGKLSIVVGANGKARMTNFRINRPAIVQIQGTLAKTAQGGKSDNNFMENSIGRFSPIASKKLKIASREILSAREPKANADN